jgi:lysophospholipase L1-like esterase
MKIIDKIRRKQDDMRGSPAPTIAFFGDSVTHGCFELYMANESTVTTVYDPAHAYHKYVKDIFAKLYPTVQLNIINAGISGDSAEGGVARIDRDVIRFSPDLTVVCFGLNDSTKPLEFREKYCGNLKIIFEKLRACGSEVIFMTPNMMNTRIPYGEFNDAIEAMANRTKDVENGDVLYRMLEEAKELAKDSGVKVCDCYARWRRLAACGVDTTALLANKINHPDRDMNWLFAVSLVETMFEE